MIGSKIYSEENKSISNSCKITKKKIVAFFAILMLLMQYMVVPSYATVDQGYFTAEECPYNIEFVKIVDICEGSAAIDTQGNLWAWGNNEFGKKINSNSDRTLDTPQQLMKGRKFKEISGGSEHCLAIDEEGNLWAWGNNNYGQLGNSQTTNLFHEPINILAGLRFKRISATYYSSMAIDEEGNLWTWGENTSEGLLGNGNSNSWVYNTPQIINEGTKFKEVICSKEYANAIDKDGNRWTWGSNLYGALGNGKDGYKNSSNVPIKMESETKFIKIAQGLGDHSLAIDIEGNLWTWGLNDCGQLGNGNTNNSNIPIKIKSDTKFKDISKGYKYSIAIDSNNDIWEWGKFTSYRYPNTEIDITSTGPVRSAYGKKAIAVTGGSHAMIIDSNGILWAWGMNNVGQLGNGKSRFF